MIPRDYITAWRKEASWVQDIQVEQDLVISRALVEIFSNPVLSKALAFRGGTALYKLFLKPAIRYSEDIDLVQVQAEPAGPIMAALHETLNPWLGQPATKQNAGRVTFKYKFNSEGAPPIPLKLKVEINTREHFAVFGRQSVPFFVSSPWFEGKCDIPSYHIDELLGTKMRALHQRKKGRDLLDLHTGLQTKGVSGTRIVEALHKYMEHGNTPVTRAVFEKTFAAKLASPQFTADIGPLLAQGYKWDLEAAVSNVRKELIERLPGDPWKGAADKK
jgi:predicted nucleotidyltransferase component of viral defense system